MMLDEGILKETFSANLKLLMKERKINEIILSNDTGISQSAINRIKNGIVCPTLYQALKIANFFRLDIQKFLSDKNGHTASFKYIPIINSDDLIEKGEKNIQDFYLSEDALPTSLGFKYGKSFSCRWMNEETVVIVKKLNKYIPNGSTLLFIDKMQYKMGNYCNGSIKQIDNLSLSYDVSNVQILGNIVKIEITYIKEKSLIKKLRNLSEKSGYLNYLKKFLLIVLPDSIFVNIIFCTVIYFPRERGKVRIIINDIHFFHFLDKINQGFSNNVVNSDLITYFWEVRN